MIHWGKNGYDGMLGGKDHIIEIYETCLTERKYNRGRLMPARWILGLIDRHTKQVFLVEVINRSANTLIPIIRDHVHPHSTIITDGWPAYKQLHNYYYRHQVVIHN